MAHKFNKGQSVELTARFLRTSAPGAYQITHLIPASDRDPGDPCYRIKSLAEKHDRVAAESDLTLLAGVIG